MIYKIYYEGKRKFALPIRNREQLMALRNSPENLDHLMKAREGNPTEKAELLQLAYNLGHVNGALAGCKSIGSYFFHDVDCYDNEHSEQTKALILSKKDEIGLKGLERSASGGWHLICQRIPGTTILENQVRVATILKLEMDTSAKDLQRVVFSTSGSEDDLPYLDDCLFTEPMSPEECEAEYRHLQGRVLRREEQVPAGAKKANKHYRPWEDEASTAQIDSKPQAPDSDKDSPKTEYPKEYHGISFTEILKKYWEINNRGFEPTQGDRDTLTYQLACDLRHICDKNFDWLDQVIPCYDGFPLEEKRQKIKSALNSEFNGFPIRLRNTLNAFQISDDNGDVEGVEDRLDDDNDESLSTINNQLSTWKMPQGIKDSIDAVGPQLAMPVVTAICPCIGTLATDVVLDVHGQKRGLNLIAYIAGDYASGKGSIDPVVEAWMSEVKALDKMYQMQEDEWRALKRAAKNKKEQPEEPKLHAFSFTPEADTVAQKWRTAMSDFSIMLRQSYDGTRYEREARSAEAVNVHIDRLLWNVTMCGTPDALFRVVNNYTDGFQSRIAIARTPDNTFAPLEDKPYVLTLHQTERIQQIAHLLPLMQGEVVLPKLEAKGREWVERIRLETMKNDDKVRARQRFRVCVTAQRMVCCLMLCKVCEVLIQKYGLNGAETQLKQFPSLWKDLLLKAQTPQMLESYDVIADSLLENALHFFRDRIENAFGSREYVGYLNGERLKRGKNDSIYERLDLQFRFEQALQQSVTIKGAGVTNNSVRQMLKNWRKQGLVVQTDDGKFRKIEH